MAAKTYEIAIIAGDGVGPEVVREGLRVLAAVGDLEGFSVRTTAYPWGTEHYLKTGEMLPESALAELADHDAILLGAIGDPRVETANRYRTGRRRASLATQASCTAATCAGNVWRHLPAACTFTRDTICVP